MQAGKRTFAKKKSSNKQIWIPKVQNMKRAVSTARPKIPTAKYLNKNRVIVGNVVKASTRWEWKPKGINSSTNPNGVSMTFDRYNYIDT